jgi:hypothetical protein
MKLKQVLKMLSKPEEWEYVTPFSCDKDLIHVKHKSGLFYYKGCYGFILRRDCRSQTFQAGIFSHILIDIYSRRLERKLNKRIYEAFID